MYRDIVSANRKFTAPCAVGSRKMLRDEAGILAACSIYLGVYISRWREANCCCGNYRFADLTEIESESKIIGRDTDRRSSSRRVTSAEL